VRNEASRIINRDDCGEKRGEMQRKYPIRTPYLMDSFLFTCPAGMLIMSLLKQQFLLLRLARALSYHLSKRKHAVQYLGPIIYIDMLLGLDRKKKLISNITKTKLFSPCTQQFLLKSRFSLREEN
jgi:hypothetical protein